jgi:hypothetical protein
MAWAGSLGGNRPDDERVILPAEAALQRANDEFDKQRDELIRRLEPPGRSRYDVRNVFAQ